MTRRRFYAPPESFDSHSKQVSLSADEARHLREVLRLKPGDSVSVFDGHGNEYSATVVKALRETAVLEIDKEMHVPSRESPLNLRLAIALLKGDKFDWVVQKATELGVTEIVPVMTRFADVRLQNALDAQKRVTRWQRISLESLKQCGRSVLPVVNAPVELRTLVTSPLADDELRVMFAEKSGNSIMSLPEAIPSKKLTALVGSEGGWSDEEVSAAREHAWRVITLGGRIMRAETAAIAVTVLLQHKYGDLR